MVPVRKKRKRVQVCLIRRTRSRRWGIPKGFVDPGDTPQEAGLTEAIEEAGLRGRIRGRMVGTYSYEKYGKSLKVAVYLMQVRDAQKDWDERSFRKRQWFSPKQAASRLQKHPVRGLWDRVVKRFVKAL